MFQRIFIAVKVFGNKIFLLVSVLFFLAVAGLSLAFFSSQQYIPDSIVSLTTGNVVVVDKQLQKLFVFHKGSNGSYTKVFEAPCSTGKKPGAKQEPGDAKTPHGIFFATKYYNNHELSSTYGTMAFHLDFPNLHDRRAGRNGSNIWIHGTNKPLQPFQSNGCVALRNSDIERLAGYICLWKTPIIIEESVRWVPQDQRSPLKDELERILYTWDRAASEGDYNTLESLYMPDSRDRKEHKSIIQKAANLKNLGYHFSLYPRDISILKQDSTAIILFDKILSVRSDSTFQGTFVKLFLEKNQDHWYIVEDIPQAAEAARPAREVKDAKVEVSREEPSGNEREISRLIDKWAGSWQSGNMKEYRSCYAPDFRSKGMNLNSYIAFKTDLSRRYRNISVRISNVKISAGTHTATVVFTQKYQAAGGLKSSGTKRLELKKVKESWKIYRETMSR